MPEWNEDVKHFMTYWFAGLVEGLERVDPAPRAEILRACGAACARSYTAALFQQTWQESATLDDFLAALSTSFPEAVYELTAPLQVRVRYSRCACDLVRLGLVRAPLLCDCSAQNLAANFTAALGAPVSVTLEDSILRGADHCAFLVALDG